MHLSVLALLPLQAAAATSAAPTILPAFRREDGSTFIDGALSGYNNPSLLVRARCGRYGALCV